MTPQQPSSQDAADPRTPDQLIRDEQRRIVRERWMHLLLLGFALSVVVHVVIMVRLSWTELPGRVDDDAPAIELALQQLPPPVELTEDVELPDPSPMVVGPITIEFDAIPNLSDDPASQNPTLDSYGTIEAPGVGAIVGPGGAGSGIGIGGGKGGGGTSFFGVGGRGTRFAYIVDISGSMEQENRMVTALSELKRSISALPDFAQFYVLLYSNGAIYPDFQSGWMRASRGNISRMKKWIDEQTPRGGTYPLQAFDMVFKLPQPADVIFFLTDGEIPGDTMYHLRNYAAASKKETIINTIGFSSEAGKDILVEIAKENRGVFRFVPSNFGGGGAP
ncbi:MAG: vWA domain-containing protein [bacterium]|jgi:hypothetical protein